MERAIIPEWHNPHTWSPLAQEAAENHFTWILLQHLGEKGDKKPKAEFFQAVGPLTQGIS